MSVAPARKPPLGSAAWVLAEREQAHSLLSQEVEEYGYCVRNEIDWLNEHMRDIFFSHTGRINVADAFKTPGRLRGKTPRTARRQQFLQTGTVPGSASAAARARSALGLTNGSGVTTHTKSGRFGMPSPRVGMGRIVSGQKRAPLADVFGPNTLPPKEPDVDAQADSLAVPSQQGGGSPAFRSMLMRVASGLKPAPGIIEGNEENVEHVDNADDVLSPVQRSKPSITPSRQSSGFGLSTKKPLTNGGSSQHSPAKSIDDDRVVDLIDENRSEWPATQTPAKSIENVQGAGGSSPVPILSSSPEMPQHLPALTPGRIGSALPTAQVSAIPFSTGASTLPRRSPSPTKIASSHPSSDRSGSRQAATLPIRYSPMKRQGLTTSASASPVRNAVSRHQRTPAQSPIKLSKQRSEPAMAHPAPVPKNAPYADDIDDDADADEAVPVTTVVRKSSLNLNFSALPGRERMGKSINGRASTIGHTAVGSTGARPAQANRSSSGDRERETSSSAPVVDKKPAVKEAREPVAPVEKSPAQFNKRIPPPIQAKPTAAAITTEVTSQPTSSRSGFFFSHKKGQAQLAKTAEARPDGYSTPNRPRPDPLAPTSFAVPPQEVTTPMPSPSPSRKFNDATATAKAKLYSVIKSARGIFASSVGLSAQAKMEAISNSPTVGPISRPMPITTPVIYPSIPPSPTKTAEPEQETRDRINRPAAALPTAKSRLVAPKGRVVDTPSSSSSAKSGFGYKTLKGKTAASAMASLSSTVSASSSSTGQAAAANRRQAPATIKVPAHSTGPFPQQLSTAALSASLADSFGPGAKPAAKPVTAPRVGRKPSTTSLAMHGPSAPSGTVRSRAVDAARKKQQQLDRDRADADRAETERADADLARAVRSQPSQQAIRPAPPVNPAKPAKRPLGDDDHAAPAPTGGQRRVPPAQTTGVLAPSPEPKRRKTIDRDPAPAPAPVPPVRPSMTAPPVRLSQVTRPPQAPVTGPGRPSHLQNKFSHGYLKPHQPAPVNQAQHPNYKTPAKTLASARAALAASTVKPSPQPQQFTPGETIKLPEIPSDESDDSDSDRSHHSDDGNFQPSWVQSPALQDILVYQQAIDPEEVFGPIPPLQMEEMFRQRPRKKRDFRKRTSSANWVSTGDLLTEEEKQRDREMRAQLVREGQWTFQMGQK